MADNVIVKVGEKEWLRGEDGFDPAVTVEDIEHGHRVTITDREHPIEGQSFDVMDGDSAYEQAVAGGYEGTEAEFNEELANFKSYAQEAEYARADAIAAANAAGGYSSQARQAIGQAQSAMNAAQRAATEALTRMNSANSSAQAAADSATSADNSASAAADSATSADNSASAAASSASAANDSATGAAASESNAADSATNAASSATAASGSATAAANSATAAGDAKTAAETAQGKAEDAQEAAETAQAAAESARDTAITTLQTEGAAQRTAIQQKGAETLASIPEDYTDLSGDVADLKSAVNDGLATKAPAIIDTTSGAIASFEDGADGMPLKALTVNIEPVQSGSGEPSPSNVRPISGWTGCNVTRTGKNILNLQNRSSVSLSSDTPSTKRTFDLNKYYIGLALNNYSSIGQVTNVTINEGRIDVTSTSGYGVGFPIPVFVGKIYRIRMKTNVPTNKSSAEVMRYKEDGTYIGNYTGSWVDGDRFIQFKANSDDHYLVLNFVRDFDLGSETAIYYDVVCTIDDEDATYEPYTDYPVSISWQSEAGTVYGGTLDAVNKKLTVGMVLVTYDGSSDEGWNFNDSAKVPYVLRPQNTKTTIGMTNYFNWVSIRPYQDLNVWECAIPPAASAYLNFKANFDTLSDWVNYLNEHNLQVLYELATPIVYDLADIPEITTLLGENNLLADTGDVTVDYPADTKLYIQKVNKPTDDDMTADSQIDSGKYFLIGNTLYLSTTVIPAGDTIIPGTNCTKTNLAEALNALNT